MKLNGGKFAYTQKCEDNLGNAVMVNRKYVIVKNKSVVPGK